MRTRRRSRPSPSSRPARSARDAEAKRSSKQEQDIGRRYLYCPLVLRAARHGMRSKMLHQRRNIECMRTRLKINRNQADERDERADAEVERDLESRVVLLFAAAPHADHDERRHQRQLVKEIEEEQIERRECAQNAARHQ